MRADERFAGGPLKFWAHVRAVSEKAGYVSRESGEVSAPNADAISKALESIGFRSDRVMDSRGRPTHFGKDLADYFALRAKRLNDEVKSLLMDDREAKDLFEAVRRQTKTRRLPTMNKQKGAKRKPAYLTEIVRMTIESGIGGRPCNFDPRRLTTFTRDGAPYRTLSRRIDGAFPSEVDPVAVWEIKEYYHTTTFGSRVADGVSETMMDGMELGEVRKSTGRTCSHCLIVDGRYTWWDCGRSYLCRLVDMLHMGLVDEILFGREVVTRLPELVKQWVSEYDSRDS